MDPITLATITSAVSVLATEVAKGAASEAPARIYGLRSNHFLVGRTSLKPLTLPLLWRNALLSMRNLPNALFSCLRTLLLSRLPSGQLVGNLRHKWR